MCLSAQLLFQILNSKEWKLLVNKNVYSSGGIKLTDFFKDQHRHRAVNFRGRFLRFKIKSLKSLGVHASAVIHWDQVHNWVSNKHPHPLVLLQQHQFNAQLNPRFKQNATAGARVSGIGFMYLYIPICAPAMQLFHPVRSVVS